MSGAIGVSLDAGAQLADELIAALRALNGWGAPSSMPASPNSLAPRPRSTRAVGAAATSPGPARRLRTGRRCRASPTRSRMPLLLPPKGAWYILGYGKRPARRAAVRMRYQQPDRRRRASFPIGVGEHETSLLSQPAIAAIYDWPPASPSTASPVAHCRVCGCTDHRAACRGGCYWVEPDLCSACVENEGGAA